MGHPYLIIPVLFSVKLLKKILKPDPVYMSLHFWNLFDAYITSCVFIHGINKLRASEKYLPLQSAPGRLAPGKTIFYKTTIPFLHNSSRWASF
jgi:hypothetical protein